MRIKLILLAVFLVLTCVSIAAQQEKPAKTSSSADKKQPEEAVIDGEDWKWYLDKKKVLISGNVTITYGDTVLSSDKVVFDKTTNIATSDGKIKITNPDCDITGDKGVAYLNKRLGIVEGNVVMQIKPEPEDSNKLEKDSVRTKLNRPTTIKSPKLEYKFKAKIATASGGVNFSQQDRTASSDKAIFDQKKELLNLIGNVKGKDEDNQTFSAPGTVTISFKKDDEWMEAPNATATFKVNLKDEEDTEQ